MKRWLLCAILLTVVSCGGDSSDPPQSPPSTTPPPVECCKGTLTWNPNTEADLAGYHVYRSTTPVIPDHAISLRIATVTTPTFVDTTGIQGTIYYYVVTAFDNASPENESVNSNEVSTTY